MIATYEKTGKRESELNIARKAQRSLKTEYKTSNAPGDSGAFFVIFFFPLYFPFPLFCLFRASLTYICRPTTPLRPIKAQDQ